MTHDPNDVVQVYTGPLVQVEEYQQALKESGIESRVVGTALTAVFGGAIPNTIELWVHRKDAERAVAAIERFEKQSQEDRHRHRSHTTDSPKPNPAPVRKEPYINPNPAGD